jgi:sodium-dependent phosphate transporter
MAPIGSGIFAAIIFLLIKTVVHMRKDPVPWAVWTSPFFFLIAGTICTLSIVYKGSPKLGLNAKPAWYIASVTLGVGFGLFFLSAIFFVPYVHAKVIKKDYTLRIWHVFQGPLLFKRPAPADATDAKVPNYAVIQRDGEEDNTTGALAVPDRDQNDPKKLDNPTEIVDHESDTSQRSVGNEKSLSRLEAASQQQNANAEYKFLLQRARERHHAELRLKRGPLGWAMRILYNNPMGAGSIYELHNIKAICVRLPAMVIVALLYGLHYDIHKSQIGVFGTPEGRRMDRVYSHAPKYRNEVEHLYSFVQIITACTASFAHGANDVGNAVGVWAGMYGAWRTGRTVASKEDVPLWQIAVVALTICIGFITYGYNIMKGMYLYNFISSSF